MFPTQITIHNVSDLQKVMSVLYPATGVVEITDKSRDVPATKTNDADLQTSGLTKGEAEASASVQGLVNKTEAKHNPQSSKAAESKHVAQTARTEPTAEAAEATAQEQSASDAAKVWDYETEVKPRTLALIKGGKRTQVAELFKQFGGVKVASEIPADKMGAYMAEIAKLEG